MRRGLGIAALLVVGSGWGFSDSLDSLFDQANQDTVVKSQGKPVENPAQDRPVFLYFGNLETQGALATGWQDTLNELPVTSLYYYLHLKGGIDVLPIPQARLIGTFSTYLPQDLDSTVISNLQSGTTQSVSTISTALAVNTSSVIALDELFLDYTVSDNFTFRVGKFVQTWGFGHLFNPGNLVTQTSGGVNLKGFLAGDSWNFTGLVIGNTAFFSDRTHPSAGELGYAGQINYMAGPVTASVSAYRQTAAGTTLDGGLKSNILDFDVYGEWLEYQNTANSTWAPGALLGLYKQLNWPLSGKAIAEYWMDGSGSGPMNRSIGLGFSLDRINSLKQFQFRVKWLHSLYDGSGQVVTGVSFTPFPDMDVGLGVPWTYGANDSLYILGNTDPESRHIAAFLTVNISLSFEKGK